MDIIPPKRNESAAPAYQKPTNVATVNIAPAGPDAPKPSRWRGFASTAGLFLSAFIIAILLNTFVIQSYQVDGQSMETTLQNNDRLIVNKIPRTLSRVTGHQYVPKRGDIIIFNQDGLPGYIGTKQLIKRVVGLPGERVVVNNGKITIYNSRHPKGFNPDLTGDYRITAPTTNGDVDITLSSDQIFVCGDNRQFSEDSRFFGPIHTSQIVAKLVLRILPINKTQSF